MIILVTFGKDSIAQPLTRLGSRPLGWRPVTGVPYTGGGVAPSKGLREGAALSRSRSQRWPRESGPTRSSLRAASWSRHLRSIPT